MVRVASLVGLFCCLLGNKWKNIMARHFFCRFPLMKTNPIDPLCWQPMHFIVK